MLKNAHIWARGAALMRALGVQASVQQTPRTMRILFGAAIEDKFRLAVELSTDERWT